MMIKVDKNRQVSEYNEEEFLFHYVSYVHTASVCTVHACYA